MIELHGQIAPQRLHGQIYKVAGEGSGGPLQAKTVYPSHDEQIITPDEDFYGLVSVTVKPVPRLPFAAVSVVGDRDNIIDHIMNIGAAVSVEGGEYIQTHALYGGVRLPLLPADVLA